MATSTHPSRSPSTAPSAAPSLPAGVAETHCATIFFVGGRAYKLKKPVDLGFLDFSTTAKRKVACEEEVRLNRRLTDDVYLGVADVTRPDGTVCDHMVVMRQLPADRRLSTVLASGEPVDACLRDIARRVAVLHAAMPTSRTEPAIAEVGTVERVLTNWRDNVEVLRELNGGVLPAGDVERGWRMAQAYLKGREPLLAQRLSAGMVRDGHGDLLSQDIFCMDDGPRILDCLEFDARYRYGDVLLDVAFLAMDLIRLGHPESANAFMRSYAEFSGEHHPPTLADHYVAYRAHVRAKVAAHRLAQGDASAAEDVRRLHGLALDRLERSQVALVLVGGLPGTGKSTVAAGLADHFGWSVLSSDEIRKDGAGLGHHVDAREAPGHGLYAPPAVQATYGELLRRAEAVLGFGMPVILDASWSSAAERSAAAAVAERTSSQLIQLRCDAPPEVALARLGRRPPGTATSDATPDVFRWMADGVDPWPEASPVDTTAESETVIDRAVSMATQQRRPASS